MQQIDQDIIDLNFSWLFKARELAKSDHIKAAVVLGLDVGTTDRISQLSLEHLRGIAHSGLMLFQPRFHAGFWNELVDENENNSRAIQLQALLMASKEAANQ